MATPIDRGEVLYQLERLALEAQLTDECEEETIRRCIKAIEQLVPTLTPPNEPLTLEQLREMDGQPAYWPEDKSWGIISVDKTGRWSGIPFFRGRWQSVNFEYDIEARGMEVYAYPPDHIDREVWTAEWVDNDGNDGMMCKCSKCGYPVSYFWGKTDFCPGCGRATTEKGMAELEKRMKGK